MASSGDVKHLAIVGAGTMGSGIALAALYAGIEVSLYDPAPAALGRAGAYLEEYLRKKQLESALSRLSLTNQIGELALADLWLEAVPEDLELKRQTFRRIESLAQAGSILATNTSTLLVADIAAAIERRQHLIGLHFFNPAAVLPLVEVVKTDSSAERTVQAGVRFCRQLGKTPVVVRDSPGFIVNRVARPFYGEALRILEATGLEVHTIDAVVESAGFPMGPFRLMDLIGIDINLAATVSVYEQTGGNERYRPHPIQRRMVDQGKLGRKVGAGFYRYPSGEEPEAMRDKPRARPLERVSMVGGGLAGRVPAALREAGVKVVPDPAGAGAGFVLSEQHEAVEHAALEQDGRLDASAPLFCQTATVSLEELAAAGVRPNRLFGIDSLFWGCGGWATLQRLDKASEDCCHEAEGIVAGMGLTPVWAYDSPALILPRILANLVNEAAFAVEAGVAEPANIDRAMRLGVNYTRGPLEWGEAIGWPVVASILDHLLRATGESRYKPAPVLASWAAAAAEA